MTGTKIFNDNWTLEDQINHYRHVKEMAELVLTCAPPYVLGIHGDWGVGKTSFLRKLHLYLSGEGCGYEDAKTLYKAHFKTECTKQENSEVIWFDAWHYQFEQNPAVALLNEIRSHFTLSKNFHDRAKKLGYAALMSLDGLTQKIGVSPGKIMAAGEKWEKEHFTQPLPSQMVRDLMENAIQTLLGKEANKRLIILVDDLDRCTGPVAFRFLEAMKVYFPLSNCVFVLGLDIRHIRRAVAAELKKSGLIPTDIDEKDRQTKAELYADDYLYKIFQYVSHLNYDTEYEKYLKHLLENSGVEDWETWSKKIVDFKLLPPNPRKIKLFVNGFSRYIEQLKKRIEKMPGKQISLDKELALIFAYLKINAHDLYRILIHEPDFWENRLKEFCTSGETNDHWALEKLILLDESSATNSSDETPEYEYQSLFQDPSDEGLFRAAGMIRKRKEPVTDDEFNLYLFR